MLLNSYLRVLHDVAGHLTNQNLLRLFLHVADLPLLLLELVDLGEE